MDPFEDRPDRRGSGAFKWDLANEGEIPLWVADMDCAVPECVIDALRQRLDHPVFGYAAAPRSYRDAIAAWARDRWGWDLDPRHIVVVPGVMPLMALALELTTAPGDRVATLSPVYDPFFHVVEANRRVLERVPMAVEEASDGAPRYVVDSAALDDALGMSRALLLCSPHNPGGRVWSRAELGAIADLAARHSTAVIVDEIHADLVHPGVPFTPWHTLNGAAADSIAVAAPSKSFNIPGLPTAWAVIPDEARRAALDELLHARMLRLPNTLAITAAEAAYRGAAAWSDAVGAAVAERLEWLRGELRRTAPSARMYAMEGTYLAWVDLGAYVSGPPGTAASASAHDTLADATKALVARARDAGVWVQAGTQYGPEGAGHVRINVATDWKTLREGVRRLVSVVRG